MLTGKEKQLLLKIARNALESYLAGQEFSLPDMVPDALKEKRGVFVTLKSKGALRGCIGCIYPVEQVFEAAGKMAVHAALADPRFPPVTYGELKDIEIEISVLTVPVQVESAEKIVMGRDGVIVKRGTAQGLFLPQVAEETGWSKEEFMDNLCCHKAGLPKGAWRNKQTELYTFQAEVFSETQT